MMSPNQGKGLSVALSSYGSVGWLGATTVCSQSLSKEGLSVGSCLGDSKTVWGTWPFAVQQFGATVGI